MGTRTQVSLAWTPSCPLAVGITGDFCGDQQVEWIWFMIFGVTRVIMCLLRLVMAYPCSSNFILTDRNSKLPLLRPCWTVWCSQGLTKRPQKLPSPAPGFLILWFSRSNKDKGRRVLAQYMHLQSEKGNIFSTGKGFIVDYGLIFCSDDFDG